MYASSASNPVWHNYLFPTWQTVMQHRPNSWWVHGFTDSQLTDTWLQLVSMSYTDSMHVSFLVGHAPW